MKVRIENMYNILGRGWILTACDKRLSHVDVPCGTTITVGDEVFTISGVERSMYGEGWYSPFIGIRLSPNDKVIKFFNVGQEIEIETREE